MNPYNDFIVTIRFQFPAWDERDGIQYRIEKAWGKREANAEARRLATRDGHLPSSGRGRVTITAEYADL